MELGLQCCRNELVKRFTIECADSLTHYLSTLEEQECGNVSDSEPPGHGLVVVDVNLADAQTVLVVSCHLVEDRGNRAARAAPRCPEVNENGYVAVDDIGVKT